jgi:hypothetical protein
MSSSLHRPLYFQPFGDKYQVFQAGCKRGLPLNNLHGTPFVARNPKAEMK